jgi:hypothetical protein
MTEYEGIFYYICTMTNKTYLRFYIKCVKFARDRGWVKQPKRSYTYNGRTYSFYKWPCYGDSAGRLFCKQNEMFDSVHFWKTIDKLNKYQIV